MKLDVKGKGDIKGKCGLAKNLFYKTQKYFSTEKPARQCAIRALITSVVDGPPRSPRYSLILLIVLHLTIAKFILICIYIDNVSMIFYSLTRF